jgi:hypothetical protein
MKLSLFEKKNTLSTGLKTVPKYIRDLQPYEPYTKNMPRNMYSSSSTAITVPNY